LSSEEEPLWQNNIVKFLFIVHAVEMIFHCEGQSMKKRFKFGIIVGIVLVCVLLIGYGSTKLIRAATTIPGSNCTASGDAVVNVTITEDTITSSLSSISPDVCFQFLITNHGKQAYDLLIKQAGSDNILAGISDLAAGQTKSLDYQFADAQTGTAINVSDTLTGQQATLNTHAFYLER
jgi:hypothetical protein